MAEIIPAILEKGFEGLIEKMNMVRGLVPLVQIDVCDGIFVPSKSWPYYGVNNVDDNFLKIIEEGEPFPYWDELDFEVDLMIRNPETFIDDWIAAGAKRVIVHAESTSMLSEIVAKYGKGMSQQSSVFDVELGIAIDIKTPETILAPYAHAISLVQCMGIEQDGFQGQPFDARVLEKIKRIRKAYPDLLIGVDGGVNVNTMEEMIHLGAKRFAVGSALFESDNVLVALHDFQNVS
jgi:ribulose-phosphate 3-epimerase